MPEARAVGNCAAVAKVFHSEFENLLLWKSSFSPLKGNRGAKASNMENHGVAADLCGDPTHNRIGGCTKS